MRESKEEDVIKVSDHLPMIADFHKEYRSLHHILQIYQLTSRIEKKKRKVGEN